MPQRSSPLEHLKKSKPVTLCQTHLTLGCTPSFFPSKTPPTGKCGQRQHAHPSILKEEREPGRARQSQWLPQPPHRPHLPLSSPLRPDSASFISNVLTHNSMCSRGIQPLSQPPPRLFPIAWSTVLPLPLPTSPQRSDQISLYQS